MTLQVYYNNNMCKILDHPGHKQGQASALGFLVLGFTQTIPGPVSTKPWQVAPP